MEKDSKNKQNKPEPQQWDKTDRNFQRTANEEDVRGEMDSRGVHQQQQDKKKQVKREEKKDTL
jgi:hypothetical protein